MHLDHGTFVASFGTLPAGTYSFRVTHPTSGGATAASACLSTVDVHAVPTLTLRTYHASVTTTDTVITRGDLHEFDLGWHETLTVTRYDGIGCSGYHQSGVVTSGVVRDPLHAGVGTFVADFGRLPAGTYSFQAVHTASNGLPVRSSCLSPVAVHAVAPVVPPVVPPDEPPVVPPDEPPVVPPDEPPVEPPVVPPVEPPAAPVEPPAIGGSFLCWNREMTNPVAYADDVADAMWATGRYLEPQAIAGNLADGTNVGAYHLVCNAPSTLAMTDTAVGGSGEVYGPDAVAAYHRDHPVTGNDVNIYHIWK